ncbi:hypothetical protein LINPERPRIM_LOCUS37338, partial [Linum perenne]
ENVKHYNTVGDYKFYHSYPNRNLGSLTAGVICHKDLEKLNY